MAKKKKFIVLDVEGYSNTKPYNIGYIVADKHGKIYQKRSIAILSTIWENIANCLKSGIAIEMTKKNIQEILLDTENKKRNRKYKTMSAKQVKKLLIADIKKHGVTEIYAYNCPFDRGSLKRLYEDDFPELANLVTFKDIIPIIFRTHLITKKYIDFCRKNNFITEKGNIMVKAEVVYRYLTKDLNFEEEHTGLKDVFCEYDILLNAFNSHKKIDSTPCVPWKELKNFIEIKGY